MTNQPETISQELKQLTDVELCCCIIRTFYFFPKKRKLTLEDISDYLSQYYVVDKSRILAILEVLAAQCLITRSIDYEKSTQQTGWCWSIMMDEKGEYNGHPWHFVRD